MAFRIGVGVCDLSRFTIYFYRGGWIYRGILDKRLGWRYGVWVCKWWVDGRIYIRMRASYIMCKIYRLDYG